MVSKNTKIILGVIAIVIIFAIGYNYNKNDYGNEIAKQDLRLKCQEVYNELHDKVESVRYGEKVQSADTVIWSPKTKTCLAYYNVPQEDYHNFLFEVWDYTDSDLVLSYTSNLSDQCVQNGVKISMQNFIYKYDKKLEGSGCDLPLMKNGVDLLTNFEKAMLERGFKK